MSSNGANAFDHIREADTLETLAANFGVDSIHEAYFSAKAIWEKHVGRLQDGESTADALPRDRVDVDGHDFYVHGVTHAGTPEERAFLGDHVSRYLDRGAVVYCEQGIRRMYFEDVPGVCEMDDFRWAMAKCEELGFDSAIDTAQVAEVEGLFDDVSELSETFRETTFSLIDSGRSVYGERFARALGDVAAGFLTNHADIAVGKNYTAFSLSREASRDPSRLIDLQQYYERAFLPQPLEREWLRLHDPELEIVSHARNERMADYAMYHNETVEEVHLIVGAAHQPGITYYLERPTDADALEERFELY